MCVDCVDTHPTTRTLGCAKIGTSGDFSTTPNCTKISPFYLINVFAHMPQVARQEIPSTTIA
jgi:hypothetical protein